jgi:hypothetical protein
MVELVPLFSAATSVHITLALACFVEIGRHLLVAWRNGGATWPIAVMTATLGAFHPYDMAPVAGMAVVLWALRRGNGLRPVAAAVIPAITMLAIWRLLTHADPNLATWAKQNYMISPAPEWILLGLSPLIPFAMFASGPGRVIALAGGLFVSIAIITPQPGDMRHLHALIWALNVACTLVVVGLVRRRASDIGGLALPLAWLMAALSLGWMPTPAPAAAPIGRRFLLGLCVPGSLIGAFGASWLLGRVRATAWRAVTALAMLAVAFSSAIERGIIWVRVMNPVPYERRFSPDISDAERISYWSLDPQFKPYLSADECGGIAFLDALGRKQHVRVAALEVMGGTLAARAHVKCWQGHAEITPNAQARWFAMQGAIELRAGLDGFASWCREEGITHFWVGPRERAFIASDWRRPPELMHDVTCVYESRTVTIWAIDPR